MAGRRERRAANRAPLPRSAPDPTSRSTPSAGSAIRSAGRAALPCDRQIPTVPNRDAPCPAPNSPRQLRRSRYFCKILDGGGGLGWGLSPVDKLPSVSEITCSTPERFCRISLFLKRRTPQPRRLNISLRE